MPGLASFSILSRPPWRSDPGGSRCSDIPVCLLPLITGVMSSLPSDKAVLCHNTSLMLRATLPGPQAVVRPSVLWRAGLVGAFCLLATPWGDAETMTGHWVVWTPEATQLQGCLGRTSAERPQARPCASVSPSVKEPDGPDSPSGTSTGLPPSHSPNTEGWLGISSLWAQRSWPPGRWLLTLPLDALSIGWARGGGGGSPTCPVPSPCLPHPLPRLSSVLSTLLPQPPAQGVYVLARVHLSL